MKKVFFTLAVLILGHFAASACTAALTYTVSSINPLEVTFTSGCNASGSTGFNEVYTWISYGDGSGTSNTSYFTSANHAYATAGTYTAWMYIETLDTNTHTVICLDSTSQSVTVAYTSCFTSFTSTISSAGSVTFVANNPAATPGLTYDWDFGDGSSHDYTGPTVAHTYTANNTYTVTLITSDPSNCTHTSTQNVTIGNIIDCNSLVSGFGFTNFDLTAIFTNTTAGIYTPTAVTHFVWDFGDGSPTSDAYNPSHTYSTAGTYTVSLTANVIDTGTLAIYCTNTVTQNVTVTNPVSDIYGYISYDSSLILPANPEYKVWLIADDTMAHTLTAVDSQNIVASINPFSVRYDFMNPSSGMYLIKAKLLNGATSGTTLVPTYSYSSLYWNGSFVNVIGYGGSGSSGPHDIIMQTGAYTSGPGFVGGSVFSGANKGTHTTGDPVAGMTILLEDANNNPVAYTTTDASGNYQFSNIATGTYRVYPEALGYETTPWASIDVTATGASNINFNQHTISMTITPAPSGVATVAATAADVNIFPNPTTGILNLSWNKALNNTQVTVTDILGRKAMETNLNLNSPEGRTQLNLSSLQPGVYFVTVNAGSLSYNTKVIIQK